MNSLTKTIPYNITSNLPISYTLPDGKHTTIFIATNIQSYNNSFFAPTYKILSWNKSLIFDKPINSAQDEATISTIEPSASILKNNKVITKLTNQNKDQISLSICGNCKLQDQINEEVNCHTSRQDCKVSFEKLPQPSRLLLYYHNRLEHINFDAMRDLARFFSKILSQSKLSNICSMPSRQSTHKIF